MSAILARILGLYFLVLGLAFFINTKRFKSIYKEISNDHNFLVMGAMVSVLIGSVIISIHNYWILSWPLIITILGWWSLLKGFILFAYPEFIHFFSFIENKSNLFYRSISLFYIIIGLFLLYKGVN